MKKIFISQPMRGKTAEEIENTRLAALIIAESIVGEKLEEINPLIKVAKDKTPLYLLGESIKAMSKADVVYFAHGWHEARGCRIEHECALEYGLYILKER